MRNAFHEELTHINDELHTICLLVTEAMTKAHECLSRTDIELADEVISADKHIDFLQNQLDEKAIEILALQGPVASDLRVLVASLRMSTSLERMGDLARHIAQLTRLRFPQPVIPPVLKTTFEEFASHDIELATRLSELIASRDIEIVNTIEEANTRINSLHRSVFQAISEEHWDAPHSTTVDVALASRYFERFGDHGVSVARKVTYLVTGKLQAKNYDT